MVSLPCTKAGRLETGEGEGVDELLQRHAVLQADRDIAMAKLFITLRKAAPSLCISMKISPSFAVLVFAGAQDTPCAHPTMSPSACSPCGDPASSRRPRLTTSRMTIFSTMRSAIVRPQRSGRRLSRPPAPRSDPPDLHLRPASCARQRLAELRAVAVQRVRLQPEPPGFQIRLPGNPRSWRRSAC